MVLDSPDAVKEVYLRQGRRWLNLKGRYFRVSWEGECEFDKKQKLNGLVRVTVIQLISIC